MGRISDLWSRRLRTTALKRQAWAGYLLLFGETHYILPSVHTDVCEEWWVSKHPGHKVSCHPVHMEVLWGGRGCSRKNTVEEVSWSPLGTPREAIWSLWEVHRCECLWSQFKTRRWYSLVFSVQKQKTLGSGSTSYLQWQWTAPGKPGPIFYGCLKKGQTLNGKAWQASAY